MDHSEDDINFLLRKAAEEYSPKESDSQWEKILPKISRRDERKKPVIWFPGAPKQYLGGLVLIIAVLAGWLFFKESEGVNRKENTVKKENGINQNTITNPNEDPVETVVTTRSKNQVVQQQKKNSQKTVRHVAPTIEKTVRAATNTEFNNLPGAKKFFNLEKQSFTQVNRTDNLIEVKRSSLFDIPDSAKKDPYIKSKKGQNHFKRGFYFGVASAMDFSSVKSSSAPQAGYAVGTIAGYHFSNSIDFETGLIFNKRNYYSEGRYFDMEKVRDAMPSDMQVMSLNTTSSVIEFPFKVKYNFLRSAKSNVFVTSGMSSYLITFQRNDYQVSMNGVDEKMMGMYHKNEFLLPAVINMSAGYNYTFSRNLNIRAEPFLKIPLKGMGIGNLPVTSAGIQFSITRNFY